MTSLLYIDDLAVIHFRTAVAVGYRQVGKAAEHVQTREDAAVLLDHGYICLNLRHKFSIDLHFKGVYALFSTKNLLLVFLQLFGDVPFGIDQGLFPYPFFRHTVLVGITHLQVISEDVVESNLEGRYSRALDLALLHLKKVVLAVTGDLAKLVQFLIDSACDDVSLTQLRCCLRMHGPSKILKKFRAVAHFRDQLVQRLDALARAQLHDRGSLAQTSTQLHHLPRSDLSGRRTRDYTLKVADVADHCLQAHKVIAVIDEMLHDSITAFKLMNVHHRHRQPCAEHTRTHRR